MDSLSPDETPAAPSSAPLAERMRPRKFDEFVGQDELLAPGKPLREAIDRDLLQSIILWGPPGTGKTTLARIIADTTRARFVSFSAVLAGIKEIRDVMGEAERLRRTTGRRTIVFIDEIHRFNKAQQDAFLPRIEAGDIVLIGATTENPSFEVNAALLSRSKVFVLRALTSDEIMTILGRMLEAGEDPLYVARRLVRFASEDVGNADPQALTVAVSAKDAVHFIGMPEGNTALAQAAIYLATAPKSNAVYEAYSRAAEDAHKNVAEPVPLHLRNAPTKLMKNLEYGKGYKYAHNEADAIADMSCLPPALEGRQYYEPKERGFEKEIKRRLEAWEDAKKKRRPSDASRGD